MDKKAYRDRLRSQDKRERTAASLGLPYSGRDLAIAFGLYLAAVLLCLFLRNIDLHRDTSYVAVIFLLDVFLTAYWTNGYILGIITAVAGVFSVDYIFTYPYWHISFTLTGFPLTFLVMMTISVLTAAVTSRAKQTETVRREAEREKMYADLLRAVSHDIRTPLTGIVGATNVLLEQDAGAEAAAAALHQRGRPVAHPHCGEPAVHHAHPQFRGGAGQEGAGGGGGGHRQRRGQDAEALP